MHGSVKACCLRLRSSLADPAALAEGRAGSSSCAAADGVSIRRRVVPQLGAGGRRGGLPAAADAPLRTVRPLRAAGRPLLARRPGLVPAGGSGLPGSAAAAAGFCRTGLWHREVAARLDLHAALLLQVRRTGPDRTGAGGGSGKVRGVLGDLVTQ